MVELAAVNTAEPAPWWATLLAALMGSCLGSASCSRRWMRRTSALLRRAMQAIRISIDSMLDRETFIAIAHSLRPVKAT